MKSYIKLYGPSILRAIRALEKVATEMPECSIWHQAMPPTLPYVGYDDPVFTRYLETFPGEVPKEVAHKMISKSGHTLGDYDFFFEWHVEPTWEQVQNLIEKVDKALKDTGCFYTITTK